jgi:hypothetical protein
MKRPIPPLSSRPSWPLVGRNLLSLYNFLKSTHPSQHYVLKHDFVIMDKYALVIRPLKTVPDINMFRQVRARHVTRTQS